MLRYSPCPSNADEDGRLFFSSSAPSAILRATTGGSQIQHGYS
jgi:hypothetical protein